MIKSLVYVWPLLALAAAACSPQEETLDRRVNQSAALDQQRGDDEGVRPVDADADDGPQRAVIIEGEDLPPLSALTEADITLLPEGFLANIMAVHKISAAKTLFYGANQQSWLLDESQEAGGLKVLQSEVIAPPGSRMYVLENADFWLLGEGSIAFPVAPADEELGQIALINVSPELMQDPAKEFRILYSGPSSFIIASQSRINIVKREGEQARFLNLDLPKQGEGAVNLLAAGIGDGADHYWFLTDRSLMILSRGDDEQWRWLVSKFELPALGINSLQAALFTEGAKEGRPAFVGRTIFHVNERIYEKNALQLSILDPEAE